MNNNPLIFTTILLLTLLNSCFKEDITIAKHLPENVQTKTVETGQYYMTQSYFDLKTNQIISSYNKDIWDLEFSCRDSSLLIKLNSAKFMRASATNDTSFFSVKDTLNVNWTFDVASGNTDSIALANWYNLSANDTTFTDFTFVIDRGVNYLGVAQGIRKIKILSFSKGVYRIQYSHLDNSDFNIVEVQKNNLYNFTQLTLDKNQKSTQLEPEKENWDLNFTQFTDLLYTSQGDAYPYLVTGVLINPNRVEVALNTTINFDKISLEDVKAMNFRKNLNAIGYDWKSYDFNNGIYTVLTKNTYVIKDTEGFYYKLRFIGFYNNQGEKGFPQFEFQKL